MPACFFPATFHPSVFTPELQDQLVSLWCLRPDLSVSPLTLLVCSGTVHLLELSRDRAATWSRVEHLLGRVLRAGLLPPLALEDQCVQLLRLEWSAAALARMASCFQGVVESWRKSGADRDQDFDQVMDWVLWFWANPEGGDELIDLDKDFPMLA